MSAARHWYERVLGVALVLVGSVGVLPLALVWLWAHHQYTIGLSVDMLPMFGAIVIGFGVLSALGGIALLRRL